MPFLTANSYWGLAKEATYNTAASVSTFTPVGSPKLATGVKWLDDSDFRGSPVMHYDQVPGVRGDKYSCKTFLYTDVFPNIIVAALGGPDSVASSVHTIGVLNSPNTGSQPPSYTIYNDSVDNTYRMTASRLVDLSLSFNADAAVEATTSWVGNAASVVASVGPVNESAQHLVPAWNCAASIGGVGVTVVEQAKLDIKRGTAPIFTIGQQGPYNNFAGPISVEGTFNFVVEAGETYWANGLVRAQQQVILNFIDPVTGYSILFQMSAVQLEDVAVDQSKSFVTLESKFTAVANTIDTTSFGFSPIKSVVTNNIGQAY